MKRGDSTVTVTGPKFEDIELVAEIDHKTRDLGCESEEAHKDCAALAKSMLEKYQSLCAERDATIQTIRDGIERVRHLYHPVLKSLKQSEDRLRQAMADFQTENK